MVSVDQVDTPSGAARGSDNGVELIVGECRIYALFARQAMVFSEGLLVCSVAQRSFLLRLKKNLLTEVGHYARGIRDVKFDQFCQLSLIHI